MRATTGTRPRPLPYVAGLVLLLTVVLPTVVDGRPAAAAPPTVTCDSDPNIFNTGYDTVTGTILADGKQDATWEVAGRYAPTSPATQTSLPPADAVWSKANVGNLAPAAWSASPYGNAQWIAMEPRSAPTSSTGDWYYRYRFTLDPAVDAATFALSLDFLADNSVQEVFVNDVAQSKLTSGLPMTTSDPYQYQGFKATKASKTLLNHSWRTGDNSIIVQIKSGSPYEGFLAQVRPSTLCPRPAIHVTKTASPTSVTAAGTVVKYSFEVTNIGNQPLTDVTVTENAFSGTGGAPTVSCPATGLDVEAVMTCTAEYTVTQADHDAAKATGTSTITNTAIASGRPPSGPAVTSKPAQKAIIVSRLGIAIVKATTKAFVSDVGEQVPYTFSVTNTSRNSVKDLVVTDPKVGTVTCPAAVLAAGKSIECAGTYTVTQADLDAGKITNVATVSAVDSFNRKFTDVSSEVVVPALYRPGLSIVKTTTATTVNAVGQQVPYTFAVTNIGNVTVRGLAVSDPKVANPVCPLSELGAGERTVCTGSYTVTQDDLDAGHIINQATVAGRTPTDAEVTGTSNRHVITANAISQLAIVKSTTSTLYDKVEQSLSYTLAVTNTGNRTVNDVKVTDPLLGGTVCTITNLAPGARTPCTVTYTINAGDLDAGRVSNQATAAGTNPSNDEVTATSNRIVVPAVYSPQLAMVKSSETTALDQVGAKIPFRFTVINTGNVTVENVNITDPHIAAVACPAKKLAIGERMTCDGTYSVTQADIDAGQVVNQAKVDGDVPVSGKKLGPTPSNEVIIRTAAGSPDTPADTPPDVLSGVAQPGATQPLAELPRTGRNVTADLRAALALVLTGVALLAGVRRREVRP